MCLAWLRLRMWLRLWMRIRLWCDDGFGRHWWLLVHGDFFRCYLHQRKRMRLLCCRSRKGGVRLRMCRVVERRPH